jgi:hypothetical protein
MYLVQGDCDTWDLSQTFGKGKKERKSQPKEKEKKKKWGVFVG